MLFGEALGQSAYKIAQKMGNTKSMGKCALAVGDAVSSILGEEIAAKFRGHAFKWLPVLKSATGRKYWTYKGYSVDTKNKPAGSIIVWERQIAHPYGHIEISDGKGHLCSDFIRQDFRPIYKNNPANIVPQIFEPIEFDVLENKILPYDVVVLVNSLRIRKAPSVDSEVVTNARKGDILTVWAIKTTPTQIWGKNHRGYFSLEYTRCV